MKEKAFRGIRLIQEVKPILSRVKGIDWGGLVWYWLPLLTYASAMVYLSSLSIQEEQLAAYIKAVNTIIYAESENFSLFNDKVFHFAEYVILGILTFRALRYSRLCQSEVLVGLLAVIFVALFGLTDELHQWFIPFRHSDGWDLMADALGGMMGMSLWQGALSIPVIRFLEERIPLKLQVALSIQVLK